MEQVRRLRERLRDVPLSAVYSSPLERAVETAQPIADERRMSVRIVDGLNEVEFGDWTNLTFEEPDALPEWRRFNRERGTAAVPRGEAAVDVQRRIVSTLVELASRHVGETIAAVSHADVIRAAVLHAAATPLGEWQRFEIGPASITALVYTPDGPRLLCVNERPYCAPGA